ncbi:Pr6Pr family membrane protein [Microbacterium fluvii]|uniref:Pr6Pr family membrane protein n=1 Tax=Microbacterium fluvii TaxID=415215 RepID=A0ABW2HGF9_9MICO|nr:Pr6Pr family membrane protein [Microbacterium fluvii]MCU4672706.1 Pr6Pr family membrane protein [Microbacterium fluvii]
MVIRLRWAALVYRTVAVGLIATGIVRVAGLFSPHPSLNAFLYYTVLSNVLCLVWMTWSGVRTAVDIAADGARGTSTPSARVAGAVMEAITVTMLIYLFVLVPSLFTQPGAYEPFTLTDNLVHIVTPVLVIVDWLLFVPKGRFAWYDPLLWTLAPYAYLVFAYAFGALGGRFAPGVRYPYPFMDVEVLGVAGVATWIAGLTVALVAVGYVYVVIDRVLGVVAERALRSRATPARPRR